MAYKSREEIVGKRFLSISGSIDLKAVKVEEWCWRAGVIRAASHKDSTHPDLQVLVEYDGVEWQRREWLCVYKDVFQLFMVERSLVWNDKPDVLAARPALTFSALVSEVELPDDQQPVEFLLDRELVFRDYSRLQPLQEWRPELAGALAYPELAAEVHSWLELQAGQRILTVTPSVLFGYRVQVYRVQGTTQWYTAVIVGYNETTMELTVTDDTVLEEHNVDPCVVQMRLIGDGVVESIVRGEKLSPTSRRCRTTSTAPSHCPQHRYTAQPRGSSRSCRTARSRRHSGSHRRRRASSNKGRRCRKASSPAPLLLVRQVEVRVEDCLRRRASGDAEVRGPVIAALEDDAGGMELAPGSTDSQLRFPDDRSDSGVSSLRGGGSAGSGDERSGSRSSALSSGGDEVWRDPGLLSAEPSVRHVHSVQHSSLLMAHPPPAAPGGPQPPSHYVAPLLPPPPTLYQDMLWKPRYPPLPSHALLPQDLLAERDRMIRERQELAEKQRTERERQEREKLERERQEREKLERDRQEREKQMERDRQERERIEKQRATEQAVHKHFEESLRLLQQKNNIQRNNSMCWNLNSMPMASRAAPSSAEEEQRKRVEQRLCSEQQRLMTGERLLRESRDRATFYPQPAVQQRVTSAPKPEYHPPPAHSRAGGNAKAGEKQVLQPTTLPKAEPNFSMFGYPPYQSMGFISQHDAVKMKGATPCKEPPTSLPNPPPLMSDVKSSVIVKNDGKIPHLEVSQVKAAPPPHPPSPKLQAHYVPPSTQARQAYEYRSPSQSPHHLSQRHTPSPLHHRTQVQQPQPHRQSPDQRYRTYGTPAKPATMASYPYPTLVTTAAHYIPVPGVSVAPGSKPKVSSPAPPHIYGMPTAGISTGVPVCRPDVTVGTSMPLPLTSKAPLASSLSPSPYQQLSHGHQPPHPSQPSVGGHPPPAHSKVTYESRLYSPGLKPHTTLPPQQGSSPPAAAAPHASPRSSPMQIAVHPTIYHQSHQSMDQLQPLDLGVSSNRDETSSPKRKSMTPQHSPQSVLDMNKKRPRLDTSSAQLARVSEPSPLVLGAATTITTVVNTAVVVSQPQDSPIAVSASPVPRTCSGDGSVRPSSTGSSSGIAVLPVSLTPPQRNSPAQSPNPPGTPGKPTLMDSDKSNSPGPPASKPSSYQVHKLKKAWLQRHSGEDGSEDTTGVVGSGSCVTLPLTIAPTPVVISRESSVVGSGISNLLQNVGTMAMSSICKPKSNSGSKGNGRKGQVGKDGGTTFNGHGSDISGKMQQGDTSSSSDQERESKTPPKRKPPKVKRKKGANALRKAAAEELKRKKLSTSVNLSESASDSDKESGSEKDTDSGGSAKKSSSTTGSGNGPSYSGNKEPRKRGRRPKSKNERGEEPRQKKPREDPSAPQRDPFRKPPVSQLKKTGETFLQDGPCFEVAPKLGKCRECRWTPNQRSKNMPNIFCRFYAFRRLRYTKNGQLAIAGFSDPHRDASEDDLKLWLPRANSKPSDLDLYVSHFLLAQVGDQFCHVVQQEKECLAVHMSEDRTIAWKRVVQGVREMCDVCETTLFNYHWACGKCGFVVCIDCYKSRKSGTSKCPGDTSRDKDDFAWLLCTNRQPHEQEKLMLTQIIAGDSLMQVGRRLHEVRVALGISQFCGCRLGDEPVLKGTNGICKELLKNVKSELPNGMAIKTDNSDMEEDDLDTNSGVANGSSDRPDSKCDARPDIKVEVKSEVDAEVKCDVKADIKCEVKSEDKDNNSPLSWLADVALLNEDKKPFEEAMASGDSDLEADKDGKYSTLRKLLIRPSHKHNGSSSRAASPGKQKKPRSIQSDVVTSTPVEPLLDCKAAQVPAHAEKEVPQCGIKKIMELRQFIRRFRGYNRNIPLRPRVMTLAESTKLYPGVPHSWLCNGWLLRLHDPNHIGNYGIFQDQWRRGQPVLVSDVAKRLDKSLWTPESFARDFGDEKNDLVNCTTGVLVTNQPMRRFWDGFDHMARRLKDDRGNPMALKLKDWPTGEDFAEMLPARFNDLMKALPLTEYTHRTGRLNLASRLPECFVRPDLGPKMYNAYGLAQVQNSSKGTTNLHLDISDAVNVMVYVGITKDGNAEEYIKEAFQTIEESCCDLFTRKRVQEENEVPGALWHIYSAQDADKIRNLLNQVSLERGVRLEAHHDPIHDQSWYLDRKLRDRLYVEYGVQSHSIVQCLGDSIFIPAGAPHQVRNLHNCIKVAEDFVSPENVSHCFHMTQEFRCLSNTHTNHEDKLQIKNIIYHAVKDSLSVISSAIAMAKEEYVNVTDSMEASPVSNTTAEQLVASNGDVKEDTT